MKLEFLEFLVPQLDWMQGFFFLLIFGTTLGIIFQVKRSAIPKNWEKNWHNGKNGDKSGDLDAEHGSVHDISQAVATKPEQWADVMPGILLVIGLLGTFLGLGIALNKASAILMDASSSGMDDAMSNLMAMMQGLGTKFKTSTWGIIAFLGLKFWASHNGFDENRLRWTAQKMKHELDDSRSQQLRREDEAQREFVTSISALGDKLCTALLKEFTEHRDALVKESTDTRKIMTLAIQMFRNELTIDRDLLQSAWSDQRSILQRNQEILDEQKSIEQETADQGAAIRKTLESFATANSSDLDSIRTGIHGLSENLCSMIQKELSDQRILMQRSQEVLDEQKNIAHQALDQGTSMRYVLESFVSANSSNIESMQNSSGKMATSADKVGQSAAELGTAIHSFETNVSEVMNVLKHDLKSTIDDMNNSFRSNMSDISVNLVGATNNISQAVGTLSINVEQTMEEVEKSIGKSLETQQKTQAVFGETSETLNTNVESLTQLINQLCDDIKSGLRAVSESGRRMTSLDSRYQNITDSAENIAGKLEELSVQILEAVSRLQSPAVHIDLDPLLKAIESIRKSVENHESKLGEQIAALEMDLPTSQFDLVVGLLQDICKTLDKPNRAGALVLEAQ